MNSPLKMRKWVLQRWRLPGMHPSNGRSRGWMRDANMAASGRESHGRPTRSTSIGTLKWSKHNSAGPPVDDLVCHPAAIAQD